jgi:hypothetical protein
MSEASGAKKRKSTLNVIKTMTVGNEPCYVRDGGSVEPYIPKEIVGHREAYAASLHLLFKHMADFHITMIEIIAEKYNLSSDEMIQTITKDPRYTDMHVNPILNDLGYVNAEDVAKAVPSSKEAADKAVDEVISALEKTDIGESKPKKKFVRRKTDA